MARLQSEFAQKLRVWAPLVASNAATWRAQQLPVESSVLDAALARLKEYCEILVVATLGEIRNKPLAALHRGTAVKVCCLVFFFKDFF
jgi:hypothetical protein